MKKVFITALLVSGLSVNMFAADGGKKGSNTTSASYTVTNQFANDFTTAKNVVWTVNGNCQKADFILNNQKVTAFYSLAGEYMGLTRNVDYKVVPADAQKQIAKDYKGYEVGQVIELQPNPNSVVPTGLMDLSSKDAGIVYFVDLKSDKDEVLVRVTQDADVYFFKQVK
jgi:hypothetical protein